MTMHSLTYESAKTLTFARFLLKVNYPKLNSKIFIIHLFIKYFVQKYFNKMHSEYQQFGLKCVVMPNENFKKIVYNQLKRAKNCRDLMQIIVPKYLFDKLYAENIFYRDEMSVWVVAKIYDENNIVPEFKKLLPSLSMLVNSPKKKHIGHSIRNDGVYSERIVQIISIAHSDSSVYMTERELFNFKQNVYSDEMRLKFFSIPSETVAPKIADELVVEMVLTSVNINLDLVDQMLTNFFKTPRFLHQNDYFEVSLTEEYTKFLHFKYLNIIKSLDKLYFRCAKIGIKNHSKRENSSINIGYFVVTGVTELKQNCNINSFIPNCRYLTFQNNEKVLQYENYIENCPYGLNKYFDELLECIKPFLIQKEVSLLSTHIKCTLQPVFLLQGNVGFGQKIITKSLSECLGLHFISETCRRIVSSTAKQTESKIDALFQKAKSSSPVLVHLQDLEVFGLESDNTEDGRVVEYFSKKLNELFLNFTKHPIIFVLSCDPNHEFKSNLKRLFLEEFKIQIPDLEDRLDMLVWLCLTKSFVFCDESFRKIDISFEENTTLDNINSRKELLTNLFIGDELFGILKKIASKTEGFTFGDLDSLTDQVLYHGSMAQVGKISKTEFLYKEEDIGLIREIDFDNSLEIMRKLHSKKFGILKIPNIEWEDIGGLDDLKKEIFRTIELPLKYPHLLSNAGLKRSGLLLWGPPGCGKTLVARAIASQLKATFLSVKGPELLDMYVGQSEKNMRDIFSVARTSAPCVIFLDEAEAVAGARGSTGDAGGAADRLVSQLLAELDGVAATQHNSKAPVVVIAATNRPDLVEPALLRPGRLDKLLYVGPYTGIPSKVRVITAASRGLNLANDVVVEKIANQLPDKCTGADLASIVNNSRRKALVRTINKVENGEIEMSKLSESNVVIENADFEDSIRRFTPSVSVGEMNYFESLRTNLS